MGPAGWGGCRVVQLRERVGGSSLPAGGFAEPTAGAPEVVRHHLRHRLHPRPQCRGYDSGRWEVRVREVEVAAVDVEGVEDVAGRHVEAAPAVA